MKMSKEHLIYALRDMANLIEKDDSFEGRIDYTCMEDDCEKGEFHVKATYRTGNSQGQGGMAVIR